MNIAYLAIIDVAAEAAQTRHVFEICENWQRIGHQVTLFVPDLPGNPSQDLSTRLVKVKSLGLKPCFLLTLVYNLVSALHLLKHLASNGIDVVYTRHSMLEFIPLICLKLFGVRYIAEINGLDSERKRLYGVAQWNIRVSESLNGICYMLADAIVVVTEEIGKFLVNRYPKVRQKIYAISNGANIEISRPISKELACRKLGLELDYTYLVFVGSLKKWHGVENAISVMKRLINSDFSLKLIVVGEGPELGYLQDMAIRKGLEKHILFAGKVKYDEVPFYIGAAYLCLAPFNRERNDATGLSPLKIFEYMACGKAIITTRVGRLERVITQHRCGLVVEPENLNALVEGINKLLSKPSLAEYFGRRGREVAVKLYSWRVISEKLLDVIHAVN